MTIAVNQLWLYAATSNDYAMALGAAGAMGVPLNQVTGNFSKAWTVVSTGQACVIAVGGAALNALYYNPCGWENPSHQVGGHTPFSMLSRPVMSLPGQNLFVNAAGVSAIDTLRLAVAFTYAAINGQLSTYLLQYPAPIAPTERCVGNLSVTCPCMSGQPAILSPTGPKQVAAQSTPYWGVDCAAAVTATFFDCIVRHYGVPQVWGRYINQVPGVCDGLTVAEGNLLHSHGVKVLPIYNGFASAVGTQSGQQAAFAAIQRARDLGIPTKTPIFADIEVNYAVDGEWILAWVKAIMGADYHAGIYANPITGPFSSAYCQALAQFTELASQLLIWSNEREPGISSRSTVPAWNPAKPSCASTVVAWQYGENGSLCPQGIDTDLFLPSLYQQLW
ncbi:DUF1906 domain-containing protein [Alicyclobacillaceae bacterium I2511]|nr:DUF1906 domain-containing protein [Alicyclobacillaceae bacterium I2511]